MAKLLEAVTEARLIASLLDVAFKPTADIRGDEIERAAKHYAKLGPLLGSLVCDQQLRATLEAIANENKEESNG
jgi:hypothetical protein